MSVYRWPFAQNLFLPHLQKSYILAFEIINAVDTRLFNAIADPQILVIYNVFHPFCTTFNTNFYSYSTLKSTSPGTTLSVNQLTDELSSIYSGNWDIEIQKVYNRITTQYKTLLPKHRSPFQTGTVASKITALTVLIAAIGTDASLATVKGEIVTFLGLLTAAVQAQGGKGSNIYTATELLDNSIVTTSFALLAVYGGLMAKYSLTPKSVEAFFPVEFLHTVAQTSFTLTLTDLVAKFIAKRKFDITKDKIGVKNNDLSTARMFFTNGIATTPTVGAPIVTVAGESYTEYSPAVMGYTDTNRHLYIVSTTGISTYIEITFL